MRQVSTSSLGFTTAEERRRDGEDGEATLPGVIGGGAKLAPKGLCDDSVGEIGSAILLERGEESAHQRPQWRSAGLKRRSDRP